MRAFFLTFFVSVVSLGLICEAGAATDATSLGGAERSGNSAVPGGADHLEAPTRLTAPAKSGERTEDPAFSAWLEGPAEVVVGEASKAHARVVAKQPYKCNEKYPAKFTWDSQDGLKVASPKVKGMNVAGKEGTLALPFSAVRAGAVTLSGTLSFSVCTKENCRIEKRKLALKVQAKPRG
jgi:hypothetical protein